MSRDSTQTLIDCASLPAVSCGDVCQQEMSIKCELRKAVCFFTVDCKVGDLQIGVSGCFVSHKRGCQGASFIINGCVGMLRLS